MNYFIIDGSNNWDVVDEEQLKNYVLTAIIHNKDIQECLIIGLDSRLTEEQANFIGFSTGFSTEINEQMENGDSPLEAVMEWIK